VGGAALLDGTVLTGRGPRWSARHGIIRSYQFPLLCDELAVWENIALPLLDHCYSSPERVKPTVEGLLRGVDLLDRAGVSPAELSFGQRRLTELLRVEAQVTRASPRLVLLDEPFAGLDPVHRGKAFDLVKRLATSGAPIILVEHDDDLHGLESLLWQIEMATSSNGTCYMVQGSAC
jgi:phospholipid/cholesterol/gamma-HCH transport system ATP-binding protein